MRLCVVLLLIGVLAAGCSDDTSGEGEAAAEPPAPATQPRSQDIPDRGRDLAWLKRLHRWETNLRQDALKVTYVGRGVDRGTRSRKAIRRPLVQLTRCEKNLLRQVREPTVARYRPGYDLLAEACQTLKRVSLKMIDVIDTGARTPVAEVRKEGARSGRLFTRGSAARALYAQIDLCP